MRTTIEKLSDEEAFNFLSPEILLKIFLMEFSKLRLICFLFGMLYFATDALDMYPYISEYESRFFEFILLSCLVVVVFELILFLRGYGYHSDKRMHDIVLQHLSKRSKRLINVQQLYWFVEVIDINRPGNTLIPIKLDNASEIGFLQIDNTSNNILFECGTECWIIDVKQVTKIEYYKLPKEFNSESGNDAIKLEFYVDKDKTKTMILSPRISTMAIFGRRKKLKNEEILNALKVCKAWSDSAENYEREEKSAA